jgi:hypothetical protein
MDLLERYLLQIRRYLPLKERQETIDELRSLILDQLDEIPEENKEDALKQIIIDMGEPRDVAMRYNDRGPIISKEMEPIMTLVMKVVSITLPLVILFADSIAYLAETTNPTFFGLLLNLVYMIPSALYTLVIAVGMIFIVFALIERYVQPKFSVEFKVFNPDLLPQLPKKEFTVSILGSVITILVHVLIIYLANQHLSLVAVYSDGESVPIFNESIQPFIILLTFGWVLGILLHVFYLYRQQKSFVTRTIEFMLAIYGAIIIILIGTSDVFNELIINGVDLSIVKSILRLALPIAGAAAIIGTTVDYIKMYVNLDKLDTIQIKKK